MAENFKYVVIGMGAYGREVARTLNEHNADVVVIDKTLSKVNQIKQQDNFDYAVQLDSTDAAALAKFVKPDDVVIVAMGESFEDNVLTVGILESMGVKRIYTRATEEIQTRILDRMHVREILFPEKQEGKRLALRLLYHNFHFIDEYSPGVFIVEADVPQEFIGKTIIDIDVRRRYKINVIALKETYTDDEGNPADCVTAVGFEEVPLTENHKLVFIGSEKDLNKFTKDNES